MAENFSHEIVIPTDPLFAWVHIFKDMTGPLTIAPHWHEGIELSYTIQGQIDEFKINGKKFQTQPGQILVKKCPGDPAFGGSARVASNVKKRC